MSNQHQEQSSQTSQDSHNITPPPANRRSFLQWLTHGLGALFAIVLGAPAVAFLIDPRNRQASAGTFTKLVNVDKLEVNKPQEFVIRQTFKDAWTLHPNEIVGRVLLVRKPAGSEEEVQAFNTVCPHLGCSIKINQAASAESDIFICPCHGGRFKIDGDKYDTHNPASRGMYKLNCKVESDNMVEVEYQRPSKDSE